MATETKNNLAYTLKKMKDDTSLSAIIVGLIAVMTSYAGPLMIVFQAAKAANLSDGILSSWVWAISIASGLTGIILSLKFKAPVITAWTTPGSVLLVTAFATYSYPEAIGAYLLAAVITIFLGISGLFTRAMNRIPISIIQGMLAGILLKFGVEVFVALEKLPLLVLAMVLCYLVGKRWFPRYAIVAALLTGVMVSYGLTLMDMRDVSISLAVPIFIKPAFSINALIGLGIPLAITTATSQNAPGIGVMRADGFGTPANPLLTTTGIASAIFAPFGAHGINLAAITAAICTGEEAHPEIDKRYIAGVACGVFYLIFGIFGATIVSLLSVFPGELIAVIAGLALLNSLGSSLAAATKDSTQRESALITFLVTISGITIFGIGAPFWGLVAGLATSYIMSINL